MISARWASPVESSASDRVRVPTDPPSATAATTKASQPKMAVLRCVALQSAILAVRFLRLFGRSLFPRGVVSFMSHRLRPARGPVYRE